MSAGPIRIRSVTTTPPVVRFDRAQINQAVLRNIATTAEGRRFLVDMRAKARMDRDRWQSHFDAQLAESDELLRLLAVALADASNRIDGDSA